MIALFHAFIDTPGPPEDVTVSHVTKRTARLNWKPPSNDGGAKIQKYSVEKRREDGRAWVKVTLLNNYSL